MKWQWPCFSLEIKKSEKIDKTKKDGVRFETNLDCLRRGNIKMGKGDWEGEGSLQANKQEM